MHWLACINQQAAGPRIWTPDLCKPDGHTGCGPVVQPTEQQRQANTPTSATQKTLSSLTSTTTSDTHRRHQLPVVVLRVVSFDCRKSRLAIVSADDIQQPIDNGQTHANTTRSHWRYHRPGVLVRVIPAASRHSSSAAEQKLLEYYHRHLLLFLLTKYYFLWQFLPW